jgi:hypothetical protein
MFLKNEGCPAYLESHTKNSDVIVYCSEDDIFPQSRGACLDAFAPDYKRMIQEESCVSISSNTKGNEGRRDGELMHNNSKHIGGIVRATANIAVNCFRTLSSDKVDDLYHG